MPDNPWIDQWNGFPVVDWDTVRITIRRETSAPNAAAALWDKVIMDWMQVFCRKLGPDAAILKSPSFLLGSCLSAREQRTILRFMQDKLAAIAKALGPASLAPFPGRIPVIVFSRRMDYDRYLYLDPDTDAWGAIQQQAASGGAFVDRGYGHIILPPDSMQGNARESVLPHELGHAMVSHLHLPLWLDEGIATTIDGGPYTVSIPPRNFWQEHEIDTFWDGGGFGLPEYQEQCYALAHTLLAEIRECACRDAGRLALFIRDARREDLGTTAASRRIGLTLGQIAERVLGPGSWEPDLLR